MRRVCMVVLLMSLGVLSFALEPPEAQADKSATSKSAETEKLEKKRKNILKELEKIEKKELPKLQHLRLEKERDGRDVEKFLRYLALAEKLLAEIRNVAAEPDAQDLILTWQIRGELLKETLHDAKESLNEAPMRQGVTKKDIQLQRRTADEHSGCGQFMALDERYLVCQKLGGMQGIERHSRVMQGFVPDTLDPSEVPQECLGIHGPEWHHAPEVEVWRTKGQLHSGFVYYVFVDNFSGLLDLMGRQELTHEDIVRAFNQSCREITAPGGMKLAYVGDFPMEEHNFLGVLFQNKGDHRPADSFGSGGMSRIAHATAPAPPFTLEALFFDTTFRHLAAKTRTLVTAGEILLQKLSPETRVRFQEKLAEGVTQGKTNYASAADAFDAASNLLPQNDPLRAELKTHEQALRDLAQEFEHLIDERIKMLMSDKPRSEELVFRVGEQVYPFFLVTGTPSPRLRLTLRIAVPSEGQETQDGETPIGVISRSYLDQFEGGTSERVFSFTSDDYQRHHLAFFAMPYVIAPLGATITTGEVLGSTGVWDNAFLVADAPGTYLMHLELVDDETSSKEFRKLTFSIVP